MSEERGNERDTWNEFLLNAIEDPYRLIFVFVAVCCCIRFYPPPSSSVSTDVPSVEFTLLNHIVDTFDVERQLVNNVLFYLAIFFFTMCTIIVILFIIELVYFRTFGTLIFGHKESSESSAKLTEIKDELVKVNHSFQSIGESVQKYRMENMNVLTSIANTPHNNVLSSPSSSQTTTQASESEAENTSDDGKHELRRRSGNARKTKQSSHHQSTTSISLENEEN